MKCTDFELEKFVDKHNKHEFDDEYKRIQETCYMPLNTEIELMDFGEDPSYISTVSISERDEQLPDLTLVREDRDWFDFTKEGIGGTKGWSITRLETPLRPYKEECSLTEEELVGEITISKLLEVSHCIKDVALMSVSVLQESTEYVD